MLLTSRKPSLNNASYSECEPDKGVYVLVLELPRSCSIVIGKKGSVNFQAGFYLYVGRAKKNLASRLKRHLAHRKRQHWHIDYFLDTAEVRSVWVKGLKRNSAEKEECRLAEKLRTLSPFSLPQLKHLGASDCRCPGHFIFSRPNPDEINSLLGALKLTRRNIHEFHV